MVAVTGTLINSTDGDTLGMELVQKREEITKHKGGRPTKYCEEYPQLLLDYTKEMAEKKRLPLIEDFAFIVSVDVDTVTNWSKKYKQFFGAIKDLKAVQSSMLQRGIFEGNRNVAGGIFLLKNNHGFKDKHEVDHTTSGERIDKIELVTPEGLPKPKDVKAKPKADN